VGIDVSQDWVDVVVLIEEQKVEQRRADRSEAALRSLARKLLSYGPRAVVLEATGGLERRVVSVLASAGLPVVRMNPKRVRDFARAHGLLAKTDALDAYALALFGARMQPALRQWPEAERLQLAAWVARQQQLTEQRAIERTRLRRCEEAALRRSVERVIAFLGKELARIDQQITGWLEKSAVWSEQETLLRTAPGVGPKTARVLLAQLPELGQLNRREIASLAGLAPVAADSGKWRGRRRIQGGRSGVRSILYLASWAAVRRAGRFQDTYRRMVEGGKPRQTALIAIARKLLVALNEMMRHHQPWRSAESQLPA
jgi:transposase